MGENDENGSISWTSLIATVVKYTFVYYVSKMEKEIEQWEEKILRPAVWTMAGEVTATDRDPDGLLEEDLDFKQVPATGIVIVFAFIYKLECILLCSCLFCIFSCLHLLFIFIYFHIYFVYFSR